MITIAIVDDEELVCSYLRRIFHSAPDLSVIGHAHDIIEGTQLIRRRRPAVTLIDVRMPGGSGVMLLNQLAHENLPGIPLVLTNHAEDSALIECIQAGARGFLLKSLAPQQSISAVRLAADGFDVLSPGVDGRTLARTPETSPTLPGLTTREQEVLRAVARGYSNAEIARLLGLSVPTVKGHVSALLAKAECRSRVQLALFAEQAVREPGR